jgi:hypothetical protein
VDYFIVTLFQDTFNAVNLLLALVDFLLLFLQSDLGLLVYFLLLCGNAIKLLAHVLYLFDLRMVNVGLAGDLLVLFLDFLACLFILLGHFPLRLLCFCQLDLYISEGVLKLFVLNFTKSKHLFVLHLSALLAFNAKSAACFDSLTLNF